MSIEDLKAECAEQGVTMPEQVAYVLATAEWETDGTFEPVREAYWLSEEWRERNLRYYPYYGRGYVQLTWETNYRKYENITGMPLVAYPDLALENDLAAQILAHGMRTGAFTGRKLSDYINAEGVDFVGARRIVNGTDRAEAIAALAEQHLAALKEQAANG